MSVNRLDGARLPTHAARVVVVCVLFALCVIASSQLEARAQTGTAELTSVKQLRNAIVAAGFPCAHFKDVGRSKNGVDTGMCLLSKKRLADHAAMLITYASHEQMVAELAPDAPRTQVCASGLGYQVVVGQNWTIVVTNQTLIQQLAARLGAQVQFVAC